MTSLIQIGLSFGAGLFFLVRLGIFLYQAHEHGKIIESRTRRSAR